MNNTNTWYQRVPIGYEIIEGKRKQIRKPTYKYLDRYNHEIDDSDELQRITKLMIPHIYHDVYINPNPNGKIQAIGTDKKNRQQYIYNKEYVLMRNEEKFCHMIEFGKILPYLVSDIDTIIKQNANKINKPSKEFMIALTLKIMFLCNFRVGNSTYEKKYQTRGMTTLSPQNVKILTDHILINFIGKKGVINQCSIYQDEIYDIIGKLYNDTAKNKNKYIFYYYDSNTSSDSQKRPIKSSDINLFLSKYGEFTSKNLRTWIANYLLTEFLVQSGPCNTKKECSKNIKNAIEYVAQRLHHTPGICRKSYIDKYIINLYLHNNNLWRDNILNNYKKRGIYDPTHNLLINLFVDSCEL